ncbi:hypothetical protein TCAL_15878 [Tigriopus californicus]|uniref:Uncharacterized protein n=1 Tax=Tigriopus californicus TaxID=6832 RepID=A0A553NQU6_TIGCA|nr:hypothetical protein TCAL_15878 [Tigriopus californicus]
MNSPAINTVSYQSNKVCPIKLSKSNPCTWGGLYVVYSNRSISGGILRRRKSVDSMLPADPVQIG